MKLFPSFVLCLSCFIYSVSAAAISGKIEKNNQGGLDGKLTINDKVGGVNVGAGVQGNNQGRVEGEVGAGKNGDSIKVNYNEAPGSKSYGPSATINLHQSDTSKIDATLSHSKNENNGFKFEENSGGLNYADKSRSNAGISLSHIPGIKDTFSQSAGVNVLNSGDHNVRLDGHHTEVKYNHGPRIEEFGGKVTYENANGHGAFVSSNHVPQAHTTTINAGGKANLFTSSDKGTTVDFNAGAQQSRSPLGVRTEGNVGLQVQVKMPPPPPPKKIDRWDPKNSPFYYDGCGNCCWGQKKWSTTCATPDDYD